MSGDIRPSQKAVSFTESVIREMTRLDAARRHQPVAGVPGLRRAEEVKEAARQAIADDVNQYPITWGAEGFRRSSPATTGNAMGWIGSTRSATSRSRAGRRRR